MSTHPIFIDGAWVPGADVTLNENPSDLDAPLGEYGMASLAQTDDAIAAAAAAAVTWGRSPAAERATLLEGVAARLLARRDELGEQLAREEGKTRAEGIGEVTRAAQTFSYYANHLFTPQGEVLASRRQDTSIHTRRKPLGVVGIIAPWNFPLAVPSWKIAPALAAGNTVVFKPAEAVPASAASLAEIIADAGAPAGVFNLVTGRGSIVGERFATHPDVAAVSFTGSTRVGRHLLATAHATGSKRVQAEMGGKNPLVVAADADLDLAVRVAIDSCFGATGQRCTASSRLIVDNAVHDDFVRRMTAATAAIRVGHALDPATTMGPVATHAQLETDLAAIALGQREGAELLTGGALLERSTRGYYLEPTLFAGGQSSMRLNQDEIFGPVACIIEADGIEHAIEIANDVPYGLSAGIVTTGLATSERFQAEVRAGLVSVNASPAVSELHAPFGGVGASSYGPREQGTRAFDFYTTTSSHFVSFGG
ncbi:aldehyde dehydrogenase family protein [Leucobacter aridicollis]|uniref:aldehyde dehydrogenase family protein n=1 Tax=Leucobacter aridicollis TaxID=283878 RepID=UPI0021057DF9|nr:aldehyde dehydrogenase family protein [Leucobacter aridicollis]UTX53733.1 aldehyde dehydrogenase family protein [Leucobacter aridicollis]